MKSLMRLILFAALGPWTAAAGSLSPAREAGYLYLSPVPGAPYVSDQTRFVLLRFVNVSPAEITNLATDFITVAGLSSGLHSGSVRVASDGRTVIYEMPPNFSQNESVTVTLSPRLAAGTLGALGAFEYQFMITAPMSGTPLPGMPSTTPGGLDAQTPPGSGLLTASGSTTNSGTGSTNFTAATLPNGVSVPTGFPKVTISVNEDPSPGCLFLENALGGVPPYTMILDNRGLPVWYRRGRMSGLTIQKNGQLTWYPEPGSGFISCDQNFHYTKTYTTSNGYQTDGHDLKVLADGSYFMLGNRANSVDLSLHVPGASGWASVTETVIQGFTAKGELIFQWRAWDNYQLRDQRDYVDFPHMNGLDIDEDGNLLVSCRQLSEVTKINRDNGDIIWRLGGAHSDFTFVNDPLNGISFQHNISALGHGHYLVFDNGNYHVPLESRAAEYELDPTSRTATLAWQFRDSPKKFASYLGSAQRLPNGNTLINFVLAKYPKVIEVDAAGARHFELSMAPGSDAYRACRLPWNGVVEAPYLIAEPQLDNLTLIFNKFGDTNVAYYRIYAGPSPQPKTLLATSTTTLKRLTNLENGRLYYFRVTAVNPQGVESGYSNEESLLVNMVKAGEQMVKNGDLSQGRSYWSWTLTGGASAQWQITNGLSCVEIAKGGNGLASIQLKQGPMPIIQGWDYILEFDAWAQGPRYMEAKVSSMATPYVDYNLLGGIFLTPVKTHFRFVFTMKETSDFNAFLMFNLGASTLGVYLDNISLFTPPPGDFNQDGSQNLQDLAILSSQWLKQQPQQVSDMDGNGKVDFNDFARFGKYWNPAGQ
jgi:hypothetical protein